MNKLLFGCIVSSMIVGCAGTYEQIPPEQARFEQVCNTPGLAKDKVYDKTLQWISRNFKSAKSVIEYQDRNAGTIIGNGRTNFGNFVEIPVSFTMEITIKDGKYRVVFDNLVAWWGKYQNMPNSIQGADNLAEVHAKFAEMCYGLHEYIYKKDDNW